MLAARGAAGCFGGPRMVSPLGYSLTGAGCKIVPVIGEGMLSERRVRVVCTAWLAAHGCNQGVEAKGLTRLAAAGGNQGMQAKAPEVSGLKAVKTMR